MTHEQLTNEETARRRLWLEEDAHEAALRHAVTASAAALFVRDGFVKEGLADQVRPIVEAYRDELTNYDLGMTPESKFPDPLKTEIRLTEDHVVRFIHRLCTEIAPIQVLRRYVDTATLKTDNVLVFLAFAVGMSAQNPVMRDLETVKVALQEQVGEYLGQAKRTRLYWRTAPKLKWVQHVGIPGIDEPFTGWRMRVRLAAIDLDTMQPLPVPQTHVSGEFNCIYL